MAVNDDPRRDESPRKTEVTQSAIETNYGTEVLAGDQNREIHQQAGISKVEAFNKVSLMKPIKRSMLFLTICRRCTDQDHPGECCSTC